MSHPFFQVVHDPARHPLVMGILNVTPDSFSDGGRFATKEAATRHGLEMLSDGADIIDVGAESTRPGADEVPPAEQIRRALPVIQTLHASAPSAAISIDTRSATVAEAALDAGACLINDVSALRDDRRMAEVAEAASAGVVLMHRRGNARNMQVGGGPHYDDVVTEVRDFLRERAGYATKCGIARDRILLDPGIGFGKRREDNWRLLRAIGVFVELEFPTLIGASRKSFLGRIVEPIRPDTATQPEQRIHGSLACVAWAMLAGAAVLRVHDVRPTVEILTVLRAIRGA